MAREFKSGVATNTLQVTGGTPGIGKVLTSDGSGNASWETAGGGSSSPVDVAVQTFDIAIWNAGQSAAQEQFSAVIMPETAMDAVTIRYFLKAKNATNPTVEVGIYDASGAKLVSQTHTPTAIGFHAVTITSQALVAGTRYFLSIVNQTAGDTTTTFACRTDNDSSTNTGRSAGGRSSLASSISSDTATAVIMWLRTEGTFDGASGGGSAAFDHGLAYAAANGFNLS